MANATRRSILESLQAQLETITSDNGFATDMGERVFYWHDLPFEYAETGAVTFRDIDEISEFNNNFYNNTLQIEIEAIQFSSDLMVDGINLLVDLLDATVRSHWADNVISVRTTGNAKDVETKGQTCLRVTLSLEVKYRMGL